MLAARALLILSVALGAPASARGIPGPLGFEAAGGTVHTEARSFCWPEENLPSVCHDGPFVANPSRYVAVNLREMVTISFPHDKRPKLVRVQVWEPLPDDADVRRTPHGRKVTEHLLPPKRSTTWQVALPPGRYVVGIGGFWEDRSAAWVVGVEVAGAAAARDIPWTAVALVVGAASGSGAMLLLRRRRRPVAPPPQPTGS